MGRSRWLQKAAVGSAIVAVFAVAGCGGDGSGGGGLKEALASMSVAALGEGGTLGYSSPGRIKAAYGTDMETVQVATQGLPGPVGKSAMVPGRPFGGLNDVSELMDYDWALTVSPPNGLGIVAGYQRSRDEIGPTLESAGYVRDGDTYRWPGSEVESPLFPYSAVAYRDDRWVFARDVGALTGYGSGSLLDNATVAALVKCLGDVDVVQMGVGREVVAAPPRSASPAPEAVVDGADVRGAAAAVSVPNAERARGIVCLAVSDPTTAARVYTERWATLVSRTGGGAFAERFELDKAEAVDQTVRLILKPRHEGAAALGSTLQLLIRGDLPGVG